MRVLLNAEPFGFGPAAAIAAIASELHGTGILVSYIGSGHTHDLQQDVHYDEVYDVTEISGSDISARLTEIAPQYDLFLTAMDFDMAELAKRAGMRVAIYDALAWYWKSLPPIAARVDLYLAQNFAGVEERIRDNHEAFGNAHLVPPITAKHERSKSPEHVLLNLGGLRNPFWELEDAVRYAAMIVAAVTKIVGDDNLIITTSREIASKLNNPNVKSYDRQSMMDILANTKYAYMTSGLGNIYDAAAYDIPTVWLPPANDSQGQQLQMLAHEGLLDEYIDWSDVTEGVDYHDEQTRVMDKISAILRRDDTPELLSGLLEQKSKRVAGLSGTKTAKLLEIYGSNGVSEICEIVLKFLGGAK